MTLYYGGTPGHKPGDTIRPNDGTLLYATSIRVYGKLQAAMAGHGDLYRVTPYGTYGLSHDDTIPTIWAQELEILSVVDRYCRITPSEHRRLQRIWRAERKHRKDAVR